jgi:hypothetical protein
MPGLTNITDEGSRRGTTDTKLVDDHDRGAHDFYTTGDSTPAAPVLSSISPTTVAAAAGAGTVTMTGTGFRDGAVIRIDGREVATTFVSATSLTTSYDPTTAGTRQFTVRNPDGDTTVAKPFVVT